MERRDTVINGRNYQMLLPPVRSAMPLCAKVAVLLGPVFGALGKDVNDGGMQAFAGALQRVDPEAADALFMEAVRISHLCYDRQPVSDPALFERHFGSCRADVYPVSLWALWECVRDFFPQLEVFAQKAQESLAKTSPESPSPSGGRSTGG